MNNKTKSAGTECVAVFLSSLYRQVSMPDLSFKRFELECKRRLWTLTFTISIHLVRRLIANMFISHHISFVTISGSVFEH